MSSSTKTMGTNSSITAGTAGQPKIEKKIMEEKIAKVREVVKNISTNDIVLALHNFELDVERTIHAFCEGGSEIALGDWEKTTVTKKRNNKKKAKGTMNGAAVPNGDDTHSTRGNLSNKGPFGTSSISSTVSSATYSNGFTSNSNNNNHQQTQPNLLNGVPEKQLNGVPPTMPDEFIVKDVVGEGWIPMYNKSIPSLFNAPPSSAPTDTKGIAPIGSADAFLTASSINDAAPTEHSVVTQPVGSIDSHRYHFDQNKRLFENEITYAQENIHGCFKKLRDSLASREQQLLAELVECRRNGLSYFSSRAEILEKLLAKNGAGMASTEWEEFNAKKSEELETALTARFLQDISALEALIAAIGKFGKVIPTKMVVSSAKKEEEQLPANPATTAPTNSTAHPRASIQQLLRRSNSPSSLVSSVDSGLGGQISPVNQEKGPVAQVEVQGGIVLKSDTVSVDQLAEIQRNILESLKAKGIDPSVLADINSSIVTAPRRRPPPTNKSTNEPATGGGGNNNKQQRSQRNAKGGGGGGQMPRNNNNKSTK